MSSELACAYAALILYDEDIEITPEKMNTLITAAKIKDYEPIWATIFAKALKGADLKSYFTSFGTPSAAPVAAQNCIAQVSIKHVQDNEQVVVTC